MNISSNTDVLIAKEDIICYKIVDLDLESIYQEFMYEYNVRNPKIRLIKDYNNSYGLFDIYKGYHSYQTFILSSLRLIQLGNTTYIVVKCIIPKGSRYYKNSDEYVSNQIIIIEPCLGENIQK